MNGNYDQVYVLTDEQVAKCCLLAFDKWSTPMPLGDIIAPTTSALPNHDAFLGTPINDILVLPAGEEHKNLSSVQRVWDFLFAHGATRASLLINLGGGVICDLGGFAASTYMRGIDYLNIPTTLLAMVDAGTGGKTGVDYSPASNSDSTPAAQCSNSTGGLLKNAIGVFAEPIETVIEPRFLATLPPEQLLSGYAEMLKHAMLQSPKALDELIDYDLNRTAAEQFGGLIRQSVAFKQSIVAQDPHDNGLRQALNLGHTIGHAIESLLLDSQRPMANGQQPAPHGYCVMYGLVAEAYLSHALCGLPTEVVSTLSRFMLENYGAAPITCNDYDRLLTLMRHDKKNMKQGAVTCTLLASVGQPRIGQTIPPDLLRESIEYLCSL